eukprot:scaffold35291_cov55-Phaeocystis_antarctica.AAC.2
MPGTLVSRINPSGRGMPRLGFRFAGVSITPPPPRIRAGRNCDGIHVGRLYGPRRCGLSSPGTGYTGRELWRFAPAARYDSDRALALLLARRQRGGLKVGKSGMDYRDEKQGSDCTRIASCSLLPRD